MRLLPGLLFVATLAACHAQPQKAVPDAASEDGFLSTPTRDTERVGKVLPLHGSEDASQLLRYNPPAAPASDTTAGYYAHARFDWTLPVTLARPLGQHRLRQVLNQSRLDELDRPEVYGRSARTGCWTYAQAGTDADSVFTALALSWKLYNSRAEAPRIYAAATLQGYQRVVAAALVPQLAAAAGPPSLPVAQAAQRSAELRNFVVANDHPAIIVLKADRTFAGRNMWDALLSLGLRWGNEDLFHWNNPAPERGGGDWLFDVATSTEPGYFLPEEVAAGRMNPADLVFYFSIPRTAAPEQVLASMHRAAAYCQRRLGGQLLSEAGQPFDLAAEQQKCRAVEAQLRTRQLQPGVGDALYLF